MSSTVNAATFVCGSCGHAHAKWAGRCSACGDWGEIADKPVRSDSILSLVPTLQPLADLDCVKAMPVPTGVEEIDRVLGGGFVPGSITLLSGEPGIGKSTLTLQLALRIARTGAAVVLVTGEEAPAQVAARAARIHKRSMPATLSVLDTVRVEQVIDVLRRHRPAMVVVDSVQMLSCGSEAGSAGSTGQLRAVGALLAEAARRLDVSVVMIGHVTKDGSLAGPRTLEHVVDTVLSFDGDRSSDLRCLRAVKHRFGPTSEVGLFEMIPAGLRPVGDASARFLADRNAALPGSAVCPVLDGRRPVMVEIQSLVRMVESAPKVTAHGVVGGRLHVVATVAGRAWPDLLGRADVLVSAVGGIRVTDPGADLAILMAALSAARSDSLPSSTAYCGEIGLSGELRRIAAMERRLLEAHRLGFTDVVVPRSAPDGPPGLRLHRCASIAEAAEYLNVAGV